MSQVALIGDNRIGNESKLLRTAWERNDQRTHVYLLSEIAHIEKHKNPTRLNEFFAALREAKGTAARRVSAMRDYVLHFGNVEMVGGKLAMRREKIEGDDGKITRGDLIERSEAEFKEIFQKAVATSWVTFKKPDENKPSFDLQKVLLGTLTRILVETGNQATLEEIEKVIEEQMVHAKVEAAKRIKRMKVKALVEAGEDEAPAETETATAKLRAVK